MSLRSGTIFLVLIGVAACSDGNGGANPLAPAMAPPQVAEWTEIQTPTIHAGELLVDFSISRIAPDTIYIATRLEEEYGYTYATRLYSSFDQGLIWESVAPYDLDGEEAHGRAIDLLADSPTPIYMSVCGGYWGGYGSGVYDSDDYGQSWSPMDAPSSCPGLLIDQDNSDDFYATVSGHHINGFYISNNRGNSWKQSGYGGYVTYAFPVLNHADDNSFYAVTPQDIYLHVYADKASLTKDEQASGAIPLPEGVTPGTMDRFYAAYSGTQLIFAQDGLYRKEMSANKWERIEPFSTPTIAHAVQEGPVNQPGLFLATDSGLFFSGDDGRTWEILGLEPHSIEKIAVLDNQIWALTGHRLIVGTIDS